MVATDTGSGVAARLGAALSVMLAIASTACFASSVAVAQSVADVVEARLPSVVNVSAVALSPGDASRLGAPSGSPFEEFLRDFVDPPAARATDGGEGLGSGVIVDATGHVVTTAQAVAGAAAVTVVLHDGRRVPARVVGADAVTDVALLKIETGGPFAAARWGDSDRLRVGDWLIAIGNPFGLGGTVTMGIVSARSRDIQQGPYDDFIQTDAIIGRGGSGGPVFDARGDLVAIAAMVPSPTGGSIGIGFAIPAAVVRPVVEQLRAIGRVRRGWLGVHVQTVTPEIAEAMGLGTPRGALVTAVTPDTPAGRAGVRPGDVVVAFAGRPIARMRDLPRLVAGTGIGRRTEIRVVRRGRETVLSVEVGELAETAAAAVPDPPDPRPGPPPDGGSTAGTPALAGLNVAPLGRVLREAFGVAPDVVGVMIVGVADDSPAARQGLAPGDVIIAVGEMPTASPEAFRRALAQSRREGRPSAVFLINRAGSVRFVALPLG
jgi:serine protease Do